MMLPWHFRGTPHYLASQARRLGITQILADRSRNNPEIYQVSVLLAQLCQRYHSARKERGKPLLSVTERAQIRGTLDQCEFEVQKLHMLAAATEAMMAEAWAAFDLEPPARPFTVASGNDPVLPLPLGDGTVGAPDDGALAESSEPTSAETAKAF
jgi:hypothetical protein